MQGKNEKVTNYVTVLRGLSNTCQFGTLFDLLICDQLVRCINNCRIHEKLLGHNPTLKYVIDIAKSIEHISKCVKEMKQHAESVQYVPICN